jgi:hypothetical protein
MIYRKRKKGYQEPYSKWLARKKKWENREARKMEKSYLGLSRLILSRPQFSQKL